MKKVKPRYIFYVFLRAFLKVFLFFLIGVILLELGSDTEAPNSRYFFETAFLILFVSLICGVILAVGTVLHSRVTSLEYDGTWNDFRKKATFF